MTKDKLEFWLPFLLSLALALGIILGRVSFKYGKDLPLIYEKSKSGKVLQLIDLINQQYVDRVNTDSIVDNILNDILLELDPHSYYFNRREYQQVKDEILSKYQGIGIIFSNLIDTPVVVQILKGGPSDQAGMKIGDIILQINDINTDKLPSDSIVSLIKTTETSSLRIKVLRKSQDTSLVLTVNRKEIELPTVFGYYIDSLNLGYIKIDHFSITTYNEFYKFAIDFITKGVKGIILDLRNNTGGLLGTSMQVLEEFFPRGKLLCYLKGRTIVKQKCYSQKNGILRNIRLIVLINSNSASASEIIAGAVQDNDRGVIIGTRSFGKGLVQSEFKFSDGSVVRLTTSRYYTPSGRCLQKPYNDYIKDYLMLLDTVILDTTKKYRTAGGRIVYGGGGIFPDVVVRDTGFYNRYTLSLVHLKMLIKYGSQLSNLKTYQQVINYVDTLIPKYVRNGEKTSLIYELILSAAGKTEALKYYNLHSPVYQRALEIISSDEYLQILKPQSAK